MYHYIMNKDIPVVRVEDKKILNKTFCPFPFLGNSLTRYKDIIISWISKRAMPLNRKNADKIYQRLGLSRDNNAELLMYTTKGLSINDTFWIAGEKDLGKILWKDINLYNNSFSKAVSELAFTGGTPLTISSDDLSAEYTGQGTYTKCFIRSTEGLTIYKRESIMEIYYEELSSCIAAILGIYSVNYKRVKLNGIDAVSSRIATNENLSWESAFWFSTYCEEYLRSSLFDVIESNFYKQYYDMILLDGLILNSDRHLQNWSIEYNPNTMMIYGLAPNYDFNRAFTGTIKTMSPFISGKNLLSAARIAEERLGYDLITKLIPLANRLPINMQDTFINRVYYISGLKNNQNNCY